MLMFFRMKKIHQNNLFLPSLIFNINIYYKLILKKINDICALLFNRIKLYIVEHLRYHTQVQFKSNCTDVYKFHHMLLKYIETRD